MKVSLEADGRGAADLRDGLDCRAAVGEAEAPARPDLLVAARVQLGEAVGELELAAVDGHGSEGSLATLANGRRDVVELDGQEPAHAGVLVFEVSRRARLRRVVHDAVL